MAKEVPTGNGAAEPTLKSEDVERLCTEADRVVPVIASRGDQLLKLLSIGARLKACKDRADPIRGISGPGGVVVAGSGVLADYPRVKVWVTGLAGTAPTGTSPKSLACLRDPEFDYDGLKPNVPGVGEGRVHIIEPL